MCSGAAGLTDRFLAESRKTTSSADDSPSLAFPRSALMLIKACHRKQNHRTAVPRPDWMGGVAAETGWGGTVPT